MIGQGENVSRETLQDLDRYRELLIKWNAKINLVSKSSLKDIWNRHIWDSFQLTSYDNRNGLWVDFGSGGGFPGLVVAIDAKNRGMARRVVMMESDQRKGAFLRAVIRELHLDAEVYTGRIESASPQQAQVVSARALAELDDLLHFAKIHLAKSGKALFLKGESWETEVAEAREKWSFTLAAHKSKTSPEAAVLEIKDIERV